MQNLEEAIAFIISLFGFFILLAIGLAIGNLNLLILAGALMMFAFIVLLVGSKSTEQEKPFTLRNEPLHFDNFDESPQSSISPPKSPTEIKLEKANEMRNNPTPAERRMWEILNSSVAPKFPEHVFQPQVLQYGYILDFYCPTLNLAIEVDGGAHDNRRGYDWERDTHLARWGIQVLRASNTEVFNNPQTLANSLCKIIQEKTTQEYSTKRNYSQYRHRRYPPRRY